MDLAFVPAVAAFGGSASGGLVAAITGWITQRRKDHSRRALRAVSHRQKLYKNFIEEASRLYADALTNDTAEIPKLIGMYALIGRMKIVSNDEVNEAAERAARSIIRAYCSPTRPSSSYPNCLEKSIRYGTSATRAVVNSRGNIRAEDRRQCMLYIPATAL
jgi:hypothetical protein